MSKEVYARDARGYKMPPALVSEEDYDFIKDFNFNFRQRGNSGYYVKNDTVFLHKIIIA